MTTKQKVSADDLVGVAEIAEILSVPKTNVTTLMSRREQNRFPAAITQLRMGGVYRRSEVERWARDRGMLKQEVPA